MRDLTEEELKLAPEWATHYWVHDGKVMFESVDLFQLLNDGKLTDTYGNDSGYITGLAVEIKRKPFDISKHEFSDASILKCTSSDNFVCLHLEKLTPYIAHSKDDAIVIAKALGVTAGDLL